jgi:phosphatidate cytidylyltransferase
VLIAAMTGLCWLDHGASTPGVWLLPVALVLCVLASAEIIYLARAGGLQPLAWPVYLGNLLMVASCWLPYVSHGLAGGDQPALKLAWPWAVLGIGVLSVMIGEMQRYEKPGGVTANAAAAVLGLVYVGLMLTFVIQIRLLWGIEALVSLIVVVKACDTGAYTVGRLIGRHKLAPVLSPGKTIEGALGGLAFACLASCATFAYLERGTLLGWIVFGLIVGLAGMLGDLAESLIKRDVGVKDSSRWLPGFGGVLDMLDSLLLAAPVAWLCWAFGLV